MTFTLASRSWRQMLTIVADWKYARSLVACLAFVPFLMLPNKSGAEILIETDGTDAVGDTFSGSGPDLTSFTVEVLDETVTFRLNFADVISRDRDQNKYVAAIIDLDLDRTVSTGFSLGSAPSNVEHSVLEIGQPFPSNAQIGTDFYVDLINPSFLSSNPNDGDVFDVRLGNLDVGFAVVTVESAGTQLIVTIDQDLFGADVQPGTFHFGVVVGLIPSPFEPFQPSDAAVGRGTAVSSAVIPEPTSMLIWAWTCSVMVCCRRLLKPALLGYSNGDQALKPCAL